MGVIIYTKRVNNQLEFSHAIHDKLNDSRDAGKQDKTMDYKAESGRRIKLAREAKGLTLQQLAARVKGISASRISNYEQGLRLMRQPEAVKLAKELMVPAAYLMCVDEASTISAPKRWLLDKYDAADARGKRMIELVAEAQATQQQPAIPALPKPSAL